MSSDTRQKTLDWFQDVFANVKLMREFINGEKESFKSIIMQNRTLSVEYRQAVLEVFGSDDSWYDGFDAEIDLNFVEMIKEKTLSSKHYPIFVKILDAMVEDDIFPYKFDLMELRDCNRYETINHEQASEIFCEHFTDMSDNIITAIFEKTDLTKTFTTYKELCNDKGNYTYISGSEPNIIGVKREVYDEFYEAITDTFYELIVFKNNTKSVIIDW